MSVRRTTSTVLWDALALYKVARIIGRARAHPHGAHDTPSNLTALWTMPMLCTYPIRQNRHSGWDVSLYSFLLGIFLRSAYFVRERRRQLMYGGLLPVVPRATLLLQRAYRDKDLIYHSRTDYEEQCSIAISVTSNLL